MHRETTAQLQQARRRAAATAAALVTRAQRIAANVDKWMDFSVPQGRPQIEADLFGMESHPIIARVRPKTTYLSVICGTPRNYCVC
jgi:hypothetical protein